MGIHHQVFSGLTPGMTGTSSVMTALGSYPGAYALAGEGARPAYSASVVSSQHARERSRKSVGVAGPAGRDGAAVDDAETVGPLGRIAGGAQRTMLKILRPGERGGDFV